MTAVLRIWLSSRCTWVIVAADSGSSSCCRWACHSSISSSLIPSSSFVRGVRAKYGMMCISVLDR